jgi:hypothetical protein
MIDKGLETAQKLEKAILLRVGTGKFVQIPFRKKMMVQKQLLQIVF